MTSDGIWVFYPSPKCLICGIPTMEGIQLGYESKYDGEWICWSCFRAVCDPAISASLAGKETSHEITH